MISKRLKPPRGCSPGTGFFERALGMLVTCGTILALSTKSRGLRRLWLVILGRLISPKRSQWLNSKLETARALTSYSLAYSKLSPNSRKVEGHEIQT